MFIQKLSKSLGRMGARALVLPVLLSLSVGVPLLSPAWADENDAECMARTISTQGHGEVTVRPDALTLSVTVEQTAPTLLEVRTKANPRLQKIVDALKGLKLPSLTLQTTAAQVYPIYGEPTKTRPAQKIGYRAVYTLKATLKGLAADQLGIEGTRLMETALNAGADRADGLVFFIQDMTVPRRQALAAAVADARANADTMAQAAGLKVTGTLRLNGAPQYGYAPQMAMAEYAPRMLAKAGDAAPPAPALEVGETTVTSDVSAVFQF